LLFSAGWAIGSLVLAWFEPRRFFAYVGSVAFSVPAISYSMLGYGALEMGGWFHALIAGIWVVPIHVLFRHLRAGDCSAS
jgi:CHASE2 domain-containing sensor protein